MEREERIELHLHTRNSAKDGLGDVKEYIDTAVKYGMSAMAITDHVDVSTFPEAWEYLRCKKSTEKKYKNFKIIYGCEFYMVEPSEDLKKQKKYHITALCKNDIGRVNLYKLVSLAKRNYVKNAKNSILKEDLNKYREGLIFGSACVCGELIDAIINEKSDRELCEIAKHYDYFEIQPNTNNSFLFNEEPTKYKTEEDLQKINKKVIEIAEKSNKLVVATSDCHYINKEDKICRKILQYGSLFKANTIDKNGKIINFKDDMFFFENKEKSELYFRNTDEMLAEFSCLGEKAYDVVVTNTHIINKMIDDIVPVRLDKCYPKFEGAYESLRNFCLEAFKKDNKITDKVLAEKRLNEELLYIQKNNYSEIFLIAKHILDRSKELGYPVHLRGAGGASFVCYLLGLSNFSPFECNMLQDSLLGCPETEYRKEPDIDINCAIEIKPELEEYLMDLLGLNNVYFAGLTSSVSKKIAFEYLSKYRKISGCNLSDDDERRYVGKIEGSKRCVGRHPGGIIIVPDGEYIETFTPVEKMHSLNEIVTHFDYHHFDLNLLKFDILGYDIISMLGYINRNLIEKNEPQIDISEIISLIYSPDKLGIKSNSIGGRKDGCAGLPELDNKYILDMCKKVNAKSQNDIERVVAAAHGTNIWKNIEKLIISKQCNISDLPCYREDIMQKLMSHGIDKETSFKIMESVRKGKGIKDEHEELLRKHNIPNYYIDCCQEVLYLFPWAHAKSYITDIMKLAYYKLHNPKEFYGAFLYTQMNKEEALKVLKFTTEDINQKLKEYEEIPENFLSYEDKNHIKILEVLYEIKARNINMEEIKK